MGRGPVSHCRTPCVGPLWEVEVRKARQTLPPAAHTQAVPHSAPRSFTRKGGSGSRARRIHWDSDHSRLPPSSGTTHWASGHGVCKRCFFSCNQIKFKGSFTLVLVPREVFFCSRWTLLPSRLLKTGQRSLRTPGASTDPRGVHLPRPRTEASGVRQVGSKR